MALDGDRDGKSKTSSAVDEKHDHLLPTHSEIAALAHQIWLEQGRPDDSAERDWVEAERRLMADQRPSADGPSWQQGVATPDGTVQP